MHAGELNQASQAYLHSGFFIVCLRSFYDCLSLRVAKILTSNSIKKIPL